MNRIEAFREPLAVEALILRNLMRMLFRAGYTQGKKAALESGKVDKNTARRSSS